MRTLSDIRNAALAALLCVCTLPGSLRATDAIWTNVGVVTFPPQIDATTVVNYGLMEFDIFSNLPFETSNTRNYTNYGTMSASPGFYFHTAPAIYGVRRPAESFANMSGGVIEGLDPSSFFLSGTEPGSYLWVTATNILNRGLLSVGANGWMKIEGRDVNLSRSGLDVSSIVPRGSTRIGTNDFLPDAGIADVAADGTNSNIGTAGIWNGSVARPPNGPLRFFLFSPYADSITNVNGGITVTITNLVGVTNVTGGTVTNLQETNLVVETIFLPTNVTRQASFVTLGDPSRMAVDFGWLPSDDPTNLYFTAAVHISSVVTNVVAGLNELNHLYLWDFLASEPARGLATNILYNTPKPVNYVLSRLNQYGLGLFGDGYPERNFLYDNSFSNSVVAADWSFYWANISYLPSLPPLLPQATYTNLPGRIQINADTLDMTRTRIRGQGQVSINAANFVSSSNAVIDSPNLAFNLSSTNRTLVMTNLAKTAVDRFGGDLIMYSAVWVNSYVENIPAWSVTATNTDTNGTITGIDVALTPLTNSVDVNMHVLLVYGDELTSQRPVFVWDLKLLNPEVTINDSMNVVSSFYTDAERLTLNGDLFFQPGSWSTPSGTAIFPAITNWGNANVPNLLYFTNNGTFYIENNAMFGDQRRLEAFVNAGGVYSYSLNVNSAYFADKGTLSLGGPLWIQADLADLGPGTSGASGATFLTAQEVRMNGYDFQAGGNLVLDVSGVLKDAGMAGGTNRILLQNGIQVTRKPAQGDLLATSLQSQLRDFVETFHIWAATDYGTNVAGYSDNLAVGILQLVGTPFRPPLAVFQGTSPGAAMYVDLLDISALGEGFEEMMEIDPNFRLYFARAVIGFTPPDLGNGITQTPEEFLDGKFGGRLRWVSEYAGPYSSVAVVLNGNTVYMNVGLRNSKLIDSDGDGIANFYDTTPLGGTTESPLPGGGLYVTPKFVNPTTGGSSQGFSLTWTAAGETTYEVEVSDTLMNPEWKPLTTMANPSSAPKALTVTDPIAGSGNQRYYRIRVKP